ncbi:hypothetical protein HZB90_00425, partial [archaeon]|nr:hypothetical protein [archaeon]
MRLSRISIIGIIALLLFSQVAFAQSWPNPGHPAGQVGGGTFNSSYGNFLFPSGVNLTVDSTTFHVDATGDKVGIGTASPSQKLHVAGNATVVDSVSLYGGNYNYANMAAFPITLSVGNGTRNFSIYVNSSLIGIFSDVTASFPGSNPAPTAVGGRVMNSTGGQVV